MVRVIFEHDDSVKKWDVWVEGAVDEVEARQAFSAVVLTCHLAPASHLVHTGVTRQDDRFIIKAWEVR